MQCRQRFKYLDLEIMQKQIVPSPMLPLSSESHCTFPHPQDLHQYLQLRTQQFRHGHRAGDKDKPCMVQV